MRNEKIFFEAISLGKDVKTALIGTGCTRAEVEQYLKVSKPFQDKFLLAKKESIEKLEADAFKIATGEMPCGKVQYSMLCVLLRAAKPKVYYPPQDAQDVQQSNQQISISVDSDGVE